MNKYVLVGIIEFPDDNHAIVRKIISIEDMSDIMLDSLATDHIVLSTYTGTIKFEL